MVRMRGNASRGIYGGFIVSEEQAFLEAMKVNIYDTLPMLVYADWLDERGRHEQAEYLRIRAELVKKPCEAFMYSCQENGFTFCQCRDFGRYDELRKRYSHLGFRLLYFVAPDVFGDNPFSEVVTNLPELTGKTVIDWRKH